MKILFIFHEARLTGASLALFRMVKWLKSHSDISMSFLLLEGGALQKELGELGEVIEWDRYKFYKPSILRRVRNKLLGNNSFQKKIIRKISKSNFDILYFNTIVSGRVAENFKHIQTKRIWHIHELELAVKTNNVDYLQAYSLFDSIIANSKSTKLFLESKGFDGRKINVFYPIVSVSSIQNLSKESVDNNLARIIKNSFVIGSSGSGIERKGVQSFIITAKLVNNIYPANNFKFVWVGDVSKNERSIIEHDIQKTNLSEKVFFLGEKNNPYPYYDKFNIFISTSKEESFGLSLVEAAILKKPIICFDSTGGGG